MWDFYHFEAKSLYYNILCFFFNLGGTNKLPPRSAPEPEHIDLKKSKCLRHAKINACRLPEIYQVRKGGAFLGWANPLPLLIIFHTLLQFSSPSQVFGKWKETAATQAIPHPFFWLAKRYICLAGWLPANCLVSDITILAEMAFTLHWEMKCKNNPSLWWIQDFREGGSIYGSKGILPLKIWGPWKWNFGILWTNQLAEMSHFSFFFFGRGGGGGREGRAFPSKFRSMPDSPTYVLLPTPSQGVNLTPTPSPIIFRFNAKSKIFVVTGLEFWTRFQYCLQMAQPTGQLLAKCMVGLVTQGWCW